MISELEYEKGELQGLLKQLKGKKEIVVEDELKELRFEVAQLRTDLGTFMKSLFVFVLVISIVMMMK